MTKQHYPWASDFLSNYCQKYSYNLYTVNNSIIFNIAYLFIYLDYKFERALNAYKYNKQMYTVHK